MNDAIELLEWTGRWRARDVRYWAGRWDRLCREIPEFRTGDFRAGPDEPTNPYLKSVIRIPRTEIERAIPVGVVSNAYTLAQHTAVAERCFEGIRAAGVDTRDLRCELGLTELGEWMNLCIYFPSEFDHTPNDGETLGLRLECFNSVEGSSRLVLLLGWLRFVCSNGLVIGETKAELKDIHNRNMDLTRIPDIVRAGLSRVAGDQNRLKKWYGVSVDAKEVEEWANDDVTESWNKTAACRVFHICASGQDVKLADPFASGTASQKPVEVTETVPGAAPPARNLYDVGQALSWVASRRRNPEERLEWQTMIPDLVDALRQRV